MNMSGSLADRLRRLKEAGISPGNPTGPDTLSDSGSRADDADHDASRDANVEVDREAGSETSARSDSGVTGCRTSIRDVPNGWRAVGEWLWERTTSMPALETGTLHCPVLYPDAVSPHRLRFVDVETTGLSTGAGSIAFLIGVGRLVGSELVVDQFFLSDYPGEAELMDRVAPTMPPDSLIVSYNGKSFDMQILRTRHAMLGRSFPVHRQLDLLYPVRRLWQTRLESCRLSVVERDILGVKRSEDIPGAEVPELYFRFLQSSDPSHLRLVFSHHLQDVRTLQILLTRVVSVLGDPLRELVDGYRTGKWLVQHGDPNGVVLLRSAFEAGSVRAGIELGLYHKRCGDYECACAVWEQLMTAGRSVHAAVELAKYHEHRTRRLDEAARVVRTAAGFLSNTRTDAETRAHLLHRLSRIRRKLDQSRGTPA